MKMIPYRLTSMATLVWVECISCHHLLLQVVVVVVEDPARFLSV